jgi:hypothetical protein
MQSIMPPSPQLECKIKQSRYFLEQILTKREEVLGVKGKKSDACEDILMW